MTPDYRIIGTTRFNLKYKDNQLYYECVDGWVSPNFKGEITKEVERAMYKHEEESNPE